MEKIILPPTLPGPPQRVQSKALQHLPHIGQWLVSHKQPQMGYVGLQFGLHPIKQMAKGKVQRGMKGRTHHMYGLTGLFWFSHHVLGFH